MSNLGNPERLVRAVAGLLLILASLMLGGSLGTALAIAGFAVGAVLVLTALASFCPIYALLGFGGKHRHVH
ncbi:MAG TPA: DUF2892 domain-containing protein [Bauldia sp.]|nr:DUF2892 domain-containing protein [Bauldia sp.]